ncbi:MAG: iron-sulfur cluster assembly scaffold protein [Pirellulaceae bacterium]
MDHFQDPQHRGAIPNASCIGSGNMQGHPPYVTIYLSIDNQIVKAAGFEAQSCGVTIACGSILTELVEGMSPKQCQMLATMDIAMALGGIPPDKLHCADVVIQALHDAVDNWMCPSGVDDVKRNPPADP